MLIGCQPDLYKMGIFGAECYAYKHDPKKLDSRCEKGICVGYDKNSPAYLVNHATSGKILKYRLLKFIKKSSSEKQTQTVMNQNCFLNSITGSLVMKTKSLRTRRVVMYLRVKC